MNKRKFFLLTAALGVLAVANTAHAAPRTNGTPAQRSAPPPPAARAAPIPKPDYSPKPPNPHEVRQLSPLPPPPPPATGGGAIYPTGPGGMEAKGHATTPSGNTTVHGTVGTGPAGPYVSGGVSHGPSGLPDRSQPQEALPENKR
jgi:hypothetical protein